MTRLLALTLAVLPFTSRADLGVFAGVDWRTMYVADHFAHGPGAQAGVIFFGGHLKVGLSGFARPGPINPATFEVTPLREYKGQSTLKLRSDGALFGLLVAPVFQLPGTPLSVELPVVFGQGAFGFYLHDEDRVTPDGRRVSEWENELLDGRDSFVGLGLEGGVRLALRFEQAAWVQPWVGVSVSTVFGYDTFVKPHYTGVSLTLGVQVGRF